MEGGFSVKVLEEGEPLEVLGTMLSLTDATKAEIEHRVATGWRKFWAMQKMLLNKDVSLSCRLKLFDTSVGACVLYGSNSWTPRAAEIRFLTAAQNKMLRRICGFRRAPEEQWHAWVQRVTKKAWDKAQAVGVRRWPEAHAQRKWSWAGHVSRMSAASWVWRTTFWRDSDWTRDTRNDGRGRLTRPSCVRRMKWEDQMRRFCTTEGHRSWTAVAGNRDRWFSLSDSFVQWFT